MAKENKKFPVSLEDIEGFNKKAGQRAPKTQIVGDIPRSQKLENIVGQLEGDPETAPLINELAAEAVNEVTRISDTEDKTPNSNEFVPLSPSTQALLANLQKSSLAQTREARSQKVSLKPHAEGVSAFEYFTAPRSEAPSLFQNRPFSYFEISPEGRLGYSVKAPKELKFLLRTVAATGRPIANALKEEARARLTGYRVKERITRRK